MNEDYYSRTLTYGGASVEKCLRILSFWEEGMDVQTLYEKILSAHPEHTAESSMHFVKKLFKFRFLTPEALPWTCLLKRYKSAFSGEVIEQICFLLTARAEHILRDFLTMEYWPRVRQGEKRIDRELIRAFLMEAVREGRGGGVWTPARTRRVLSRLHTVCVGFHLMKPDPDSRVTPPVLFKEIAVLLAYDLKDRGLSDEDVVRHRDWSLFGLSADDVKHLLSSSGMSRWMLVSEKNGKTAIDWQYPGMTEVAESYVANH
ncbi:MAG: hypothetical protein ACFWTZ_07210 [Burkholderia sp.]|jgi:hypothetical protein